MKTIEIHALQTLSPSRVNRGENGEPKTSIFGGVPRSRVSSQAQKRQQRQTDLTKRTKHPHELILRELNNKALRPLVISVVQTRYGDLDENSRLKTMVYLDHTEIRQMANLIEQAASLLQPLQNTYETALSSEKKADIKKAKADLEEGVQQHILKKYKPGISEDTALYGRFMAEITDENIQAATSYAHALSVHRDQTVNDFFSAVDDYSGNTAHIGNTGLNAPTLYRYANVDLNLLARHLGNESLKDVIQRWVTGFLFATPDNGGHGAFARTLPEYVLLTYRDQGHPVTLANAFTDPAYPQEGRTLLQESIRKLKEQAAFNQLAYGHNGLQQALEISLQDIKVENLDVIRVVSIQEALEKIPL